MTQHLLIISKHGQLMQRLNLNFALPQAPATSRVSALGAGILAFSLIAGGWLAWHQYALNAEKTALEARITKLRHLDVRTARLNADIPEAIAQEIRFANDVLSQALIPWDDLFNALESAKDERIALLSLQPNAQKREIRISGEAQDFDALLGYREKLAAGKSLYDIRIVTHQVLSQPAQQPVKFELIASWKIPA